MTTYRKIILAALILAFGVVALGAYVRLSDAGLGCPDWPGCYGKLTPHNAADAINAELAVRPDGPVSHVKAWKEMVHRYFAGTLGLLVLAIAILAWRGRHETRGGLGLPWLLLGLIVFQAMLGMWTVTQLLKPLIVSSHLLGGMTTLALLLWLWLRERGQSGHTYYANSVFFRFGVLLGLILVVLFFGLGGWVCFFFVVLVCFVFPLCHGAWVPPMDFEQGFFLFWF